MIVGPHHPIPNPVVVVGVEDLAQKFLFGGKATESFFVPEFRWSAYGAPLDLFLVEYLSDALVRYPEGVPDLFQGLTFVVKRHYL